MAIFLGFLGVLAFSFTLPATRVAVEDLDPTFVGVGRAVVAGLLAAALLAATRQPRPTRAQLRPLALVSLGVVLGFPLFTALAMHSLPSAQGAVIVGVLPAATAVAAVLFAGERPSGAFWAASGAGLVAVLVFAGAQGAGPAQRGARAGAGRRGPLCAGLRQGRRPVAPDRAAGRPSAGRWCCRFR